MFTGFNLKITKKFFEGKKKTYTEYQRIGETHLNEQRASYETNLKNYMERDIISGTAIQEEWFPEIDADIFISHSHDDYELACVLAGWLHDEFLLNCFIDSNVWAYSRELLDQMNDVLSNKRLEPSGKYVYSHESCIQVSQHVNVMLSIALQKMIDKIETVFLLNTENSINVRNISGMDETYSPWIYSEIVSTQIVRKKPLLAYRDYKELCHSESIAENKVIMQFMTISYTVALGHLHELSEDDLQLWLDTYDTRYIKCDYPMDLLYERKCLEELMCTKNLVNVLSEEQVRVFKEAFCNADGKGESVLEKKTDMYKCIYNDIRTCPYCRLSIND